MSECKKHPGTQRTIFTNRNGTDYVACSACQAEKAAGKVAAPPAVIPTKKAAKKAAKKTAAKPDTTPIKTAAVKTPATKSGGLLSRFGMGRRG